MKDLETQLSQNIVIIIQNKKVYLYNKMDKAITELIYETASMFTTDDVIVVSSMPRYEILNIPPNSAVFLEILDGWEDGIISYYLTKVKTETIDFEGSISLKDRSLSGMIRLPQIADCKLVKLSSKNGYVMKLNEEDE